MAKKCIICGAEATHKIKAGSEYYCQACAEESFGDLGLLITIQEEAEQLKADLRQQIGAIQKEVTALKKHVQKPDDRED